MNKQNNGAQSVVDNRKGLPVDKPSLGRVAMLTTDQVEDIEFFYPYYRFIEEGYEVDVITPKGGVLKAYREMELKSTMALIDANPLDYKLLFIPGGLAPTALKEIAEAVSFVKSYAEQGNLIGAVCHGPQLLATAGLIKGRKMTSWHEVANEIREAGATYLDEPLVEDGQYITARKPGDLPIEMSRIIERLSN
ncbi:glutamine amidotransferase [Pullulanibacillus camelliae]|uniref:Glutamine amidotransferase n=1 Tax=Pullulanibacillus camelliae TaxID=1707096 RepID=A0A8J3DV19_9BACL|nr:type 1 glutamine amidotransferase domain-containing protein [Pullulanibacillus camelliae]GGE43973.1 glutamine amidotransferase [Pullulanibacillus camelliae]